MIARIVQPHEYDRTEELFCIAFEMKEGAEPYLSKSTKERFASFTEDGDMMAVLCSPPEEIYFDDNKLQMSCVGGVACLPHYRKGGALKAAFIKSLDYAYQEGVELSCLYPFSSEYYRRFGYEYTIEKAFYKISLAAITSVELEGRFYLNENGSELASIKQIYREFARNYNFMFTRKSCNYFESFEKNRPTHDGIYTYVYKTGDEELPKAVMSFEKVAIDNGFAMRCAAFWYTCDEGLRALLTHAKTFQTYYSRIEISMPTNVDMYNYIAEWALYPMEKSVASIAMMRVINVKKTLMAAKYIGSGEIILELSDHILKQNNGIFCVVFDNGRAISCEETDKRPHARLTMSTFSKCILGAQSAADLSDDDMDRVFNIEPLRQVFYRKDNFIANTF